MTTLASGAEMRRSGPRDGLPVLCLSGGTGGNAPGQWSSGYRWLIGKLAPRHPQLAFHEVRYRVRSWRRLDLCVEDARAALDAAADAAGRRTLVIGHSMGGAVAICAADHPSVGAVVGLAPWIPERVDVGRLRDRRLAVIHGTLDGSVFGFPGVSAASSRAGVERARAAGVDAGYTLIRGAIHAIAFPAPGGRLIPAPRAGEWLRRVDEQVVRFRAEEGA